MANHKFSLSWNSYKTNICGGFCSLQQNGEFVDMTLAADGHFVKVHQAMIALSSPYLKELIASLSCPHPVICLNNVSHSTLTLLLEYIYTGEVSVPHANLISFMEAGKSLHIKGLNNELFGSIQDSSTEDSTRPIKKRKYEDLAEQAAKLPTLAKNVSFNLDGTVIDMTVDTSGDDITENTADNTINNTIDDLDEPTVNPDPILARRSKLQYTLSVKGRLQLLLNRFVYYEYSTTQRGVRRWRCVDYKNKIGCQAFVVTDNNVVVNRGNLHNHLFHDKKIFKKVQQGLVFSAINEVELHQKEKKKSKKENEGDPTTD